MKDHGERTKAWYIIQQSVYKHRLGHDLKDLRYAVQQLKYDPFRTIKHVVDKMIRSGDNALRKAMLVWEFETHAGKDKKEAQRKFGANQLVASVDHCRRHRLRFAYNKLAAGVSLTKMQQRIFNKLWGVYFDKLAKAFRNWASNTFANYAELLLSKKARVIDQLIFATMSGSKFYFLRWIKYMLYCKMKEHGDRIKAWFIIQQGVNK
mmetsp:Transcript_1175/g.876  ORF Transcript_1175/g.876 Transcript_1175/m.876 type:complete len:207 (-) Transcript_1175:2251-2871(-)